MMEKEKEKVDIHSGEGSGSRSNHSAHAASSPSSSPIVASEKQRTPRSRHHKTNSAKEKGADLNSFTPVSQGTELPPERYGHSTVFEEGGGGLLIVFGGCNQSGGFLSDLWIFNLERGCWSRVDSEGAPMGRHFHSTVLYNGSMYLFGGGSNAYYNDLHRFNLDSQSWSLLPTNPSAPCPRWGHSAVIFSNCMYIFGGFDKDGFACNELYEFSFETNKWRLLKPNGNVQPRDVYHHTAVLHQGSIYVFGGKTETSDLMEYRFGNGTWSIVKTKGAPPEPRWGHRAVVYKGVMYLFGGRDAVRNFADVFEFHFETSTWKKAPRDGISPRFFTSLVVDDEYMYVFGGRNIYNFTFNELYKYNLAKKKKSRPDTYVDDFRKLYNNPKFSDVVFTFPEEEGDQLIYAHRNVLSSRCPPFRAMFRGGMKEAVAGKIQIHEMKYLPFSGFIEYLYTGQLSAAPESIPDILQLADLYMLEHLKALCDRKMIRYVDPQNVCSILQMSDQFKAPELKDYCIGIVVKNLVDLKESESFKHLPEPLLNLVIAAMAPKPT